MPLQRCQRNGKRGYRWGSQGKCYTGPRAKRLAIRQGIAIEPGHFGLAANSRAFNPLRADPTHTVTLRRIFQQDLRRRFARLRKKIWALVVTEDAFGLGKRVPVLGLVSSASPNLPVGGPVASCNGAAVFTSANKEQGNDKRSAEQIGEANSNSGILHEECGTKAARDRRVSANQDSESNRFGGQGRSFDTASGRIDSEISDLIAHNRWAFATTPAKVEAFEGWLKTQIEADMFAVAAGNVNNAWWTSYVREGYRKGAGRAFSDTRKFRGDVDDPEAMAFYRGTKEEFLRSSFGRPVAVNKVKLLAGRVFTELKGVTEDMATRITRNLTDGLTQGMNPRAIARRMIKDGIGDKVRGIESRACRIARTEIIRAHAEGQLDALEEMGVTEVGVTVEWSVSPDTRLCDACASMSGTVLKVTEARGMIPRHPDCRCSFIPANVGEDTKGQKRSKEEVQAAIDKSIQTEAPKRPLEEQKKRTPWAGADKRIAQRRIRDLEKQLADRPIGSRRPVVDCGGLASNRGPLINRQCRVVEAKAARAKASHKPATAEKQRHAEANEVKLAKSLGGKSLDDNEAMDVILRAGKHEHGIELKTMLDNSNDKITMHPSSRRRKEAWMAEKTIRSIHTVVLDDRQTFQGGKYRSQYSGNRIYYKRGVGAFRINRMMPVKDAKELKQLVAATDQELAELLKAKRL